MKDPKAVKALDGGWGWMVCLGASLTTFSLRALEPSFGLVFHDFLMDLGTDSTETSVITSIFDANMNFSGLFVGPLLKRFSFRIVVIVGAILSSVGLISTSRAQSVTHVVCTYSVLVGIGNGLAVAASFVAINNYFVKKRGQAVGLSMVGTALAMMLMPQLVHVLLDAYGFRGTMLIIGGWSMHALIGGCLLRPVEVPKKRKESMSLKVIENGRTEPSGIAVDETKHGEEAEELLKRTINGQIVSREVLQVETKSEKKLVWYKAALKAIGDFLDLQLLRDSVYLNVIIGLSFFNVAETNFKLMTPFFLRSVGMTKAEIAFCLSLTAFSDIMARLILPPIFDRLGTRKRRIFWISALVLGVGRSTLAQESKGISLTVLLVMIGFVRGAVILNANLSVSECCSLQKLPHALGLYMVSKGIFSLALSPLIGFIRDYSGSYRICIHAMTALIMLTFISWSIEFSWKGICRRRREAENIRTMDKQAA